MFEICLFSTEVVELQKETPPEFRVQMHDLSIRVNEPATFDCQVSGYPRPDVYWTKVSWIPGAINYCEIYELKLNIKLNKICTLPYCQII